MMHYHLIKNGVLGPTKPMAITKRKKIKETMGRLGLIKEITIKKI